MDLKTRISSPLEAGVSILDVHRLPSYLLPAIEYASKRLAEKGLHVTLVVARRDYQLPGCAMVRKSSKSLENSPTNLPTPPCSPSSPGDVVAGLTTTKTLARSQSFQPSRGEEKPEFGCPRRSKTGPVSKKSSLASMLDLGLRSPRLRWTATFNNITSSPKSPNSPATPASGVTATSSASSAACGSLAEQGPTIRLIHTTSLAPRAYKLVAATLARASRKYNLSTTLTACEPSTYNLPPMVLHGSILQNEILHSSEGITMLSLDHLYTFKSALSHYTAVRTEVGSHLPLEDAVDELRRYVLSPTCGRRRLLKSTLVQAFDWLGPVNENALAEVMVMYSRAYGAARDTGVVDDLVPAPSKAVDEAAEVRWNESSFEVSPSSAGETTRGSFDDSMTAIPSSFSITETSPVSSSSTFSAPCTPSSQWISSPLPAPRYSICANVAINNNNNMTDAPVAMRRSIINTPLEEPTYPSITEPSNDGETTPVPASEQPWTAPPLPPLPPPHHPSTPKITPRRSAPALKLLTTFPTPPTNRPAAAATTQKRKATPVPSPNKRRQAAAANTTTSFLLDDASPPPTLPPPMPIFLSATSPSSSPPTDIRFALSLSTTTTDDAALTDFEDAEVTARSPYGCGGLASSKMTPGGSMWLGIDDILSSTTSGGGGRRWSSDLLLLQTPAGEGPMTPNGYEDISPVTRGEWGFLMVGESFRTRRAGVSCV